MWNGTQNPLPFINQNIISIQLDLMALAFIIDFNHSFRLWNLNFQEGNVIQFSLRKHRTGWFIVAFIPFSYSVIFDMCNMDFVVVFTTHPLSVTLVRYSNMNFQEFIWSANWNRNAFRMMINFDCFLYGFFFFFIFHVLRPHSHMVRLLVSHYFP